MADVGRRQPFADESLAGGAPFRDAAVEFSGATSFAVLAKGASFEFRATRKSLEQATPGDCG